MSTEYAFHAHPRSESPVPGCAACATEPETGRPDPATPAWMLDAARSVLVGRRNLLASAMFQHGEDENDPALWNLRCQQLDEVLAQARGLGLV
jgi:hypothetical protein